VRNKYRTHRKCATGACIVDRWLQGEIRNRRLYRMLYRGVDVPKVIRQLLVALSFLRPPLTDRFV
jgi:hypothetical protein